MCSMPVSKLKYLILQRVTRFRDLDFVIWFFVNGFHYSSITMPLVRNPFQARRQKQAPPLAPESPGPSVMLRETSSSVALSSDTGNPDKSGARSHHQHSQQPNQKQQMTVVPEVHRQMAAAVNRSRPRTAQDALRLLKRRHPKLLRKSKSRHALRNRTNGLLDARNDENSQKHNNVASFTDAPPRKGTETLRTLEGQDVEFVALERVGCPHCTRKFAPEAAKRHIAICANNKNKPKPPPIKVECYTDRLGVRRGGRGSLSTTAREALEAKQAREAQNQPHFRRRSSSQSSDTKQGRRSYSRSQRGKNTDKKRINMGSIKAGGVPAKSTSKPAAAPAPGKSSGNGVDKLSSKWGEIMFLLRRPISNRNDFLTTWKQAVNGVQFLQELEETASELGVQQGTLSRWLLPFDNQTSLKDQAATAPPLGSSELDGLMSTAQRRRLVKAAVQLRSLIRVKIADNADLEQAKTSVEAIDIFFGNLKRVADVMGKKPFDLLSTL